MRLLFFALAFSISSASVANLQSLTVNSKPVKYLSFEEKEKPPKTAPHNRLYQIKKAYYQNRPIKCLNLASSALNAAAIVNEWYLNQQLLCAKELDFKKRSNRNRLYNVFQKVAKSRDLIKILDDESMRENYIEVGLQTFSHSTKGKKSVSDRLFNQLEALKGSMSDEQKARLYEVAGESAFLRQNIVNAKEFFFRSLQYSDNSKVKNRLKALDPKIVFESDIDENKFDQILMAVTPENERALIVRMKNALQAEDLLNVITDGVEFLKQYPSSFYSKWVKKQLLSIYVKLARAEEDKYKTVRLKVNEKLVELDSERLYSFGKRTFYYGLYSASAWALEHAYNKTNGLNEAAEILKLAARANQFVGEYEKALKQFNTVYEISTGTKYAVEALFHSGLISYRTQKYSDAVSYFEKLLSQPNKFDREADSLYWLWRSKQKVNSKSAGETGKILITMYPSSYYGLRARAEMNASKLDWIGKDVKVSQIQKVTNLERVAYNKYELLLKSGWYEEASSALKKFANPRDNIESLRVASLYARAFDFYNATVLSFEAFNRDNSLMAKNTMQPIYPILYREQIEEYAKKYNIPFELILSLIRQESSFRARAISPSNAVGLMQLVRITAKEVAKDLSVKNFIFPDSLKDPDLNLRFGSYYLSKMIRANKGYVPLALASYNVGIGRMYRWFNSRNELKGLRYTETSNPDNEVWIDELPWEETRNYVKSILRNYILYQLVQSDEIEITEPIWK